LIKLRNNIFTIFITLVLFISGLSTLSANPIHIDNETKKDVTSITQTIEKVTVFRHGIDGIITKVNLEIELKEGININDAIADKCEKLIKEDANFQNLTNDSILKNYISFIKSKGKGLHIHFSKRRLIFCRYFRDQEASTIIVPFMGNDSITFKGPHRILAFRFVGYKWWLGRVSLLGFSLRTGFIGYSLFSSVKKL
jgi:hypothetical protein